MATTTPNYGWTVPTSTDLVKDGATAIETLGDAIDASMNTALGTKKAGMVLLNTTSFSGVASQAVSSIFTATYSHYVVHLELTAVATADADIHLKLRATSTDSSTAYYQTRQRINSSTTTITEILNGSNGFHIGEWDSGTPLGIYNSHIDIINPFEASQLTSMKHWFGSAQQNGNMAATYGAGHQGDATSFNGFNIIGSAGTMTGTIKVYGYNK
jgi:hypothetical protein